MHLLINAECIASKYKYIIFIKVDIKNSLLEREYIELYKVYRESQYA